FRPGVFSSHPIVWHGCRGPAGASGPPDLPLMVGPKGQPIPGTPFGPRSGATMTMSLSPRRSLRILAAALIAGAALAAAAPAQAAISGSFAFLFDPARAADDHQFFLNRVVVQFGIPRPAIEPVLPRMRNLEPELPVALFLSHASGQPLDVIVNLRVGGLPWC